MASRMLKTHRSDEGSSSPTDGVFLSLSGVERAPGVVSDWIGHHFSAHHMTLCRVFSNILIYSMRYTVILPLPSKGQLRHRPVIVSKQSQDLKPQYNLTSRRSLKKKILFLPVLGLYDCTGAVPSCGEQGLLSGCGSRASHCGGFLWSSGSAVMTPGISCSVACGEMFPEGSNPCPLHWQADS